MAVCCVSTCSRKKHCKNYKGNYLKYHDKNYGNWEEYSDWSTTSSGSIGSNCGDLSITYPYFDEIEIDHERLKLIDQAIESAQCRIYRLKANPGSTEAHQKKAENQQELMKITIEALEKYKKEIENA